MKSSPSIEPTSCTVTTLGCLSRASAWASRERALAIVAAQHLDRDASLELAIARAIDDAHAAGAERIDQDVAAELARRVLRGIELGRPDGLRERLGLPRLHDIHYSRRDGRREPDRGARRHRRSRERPAVPRRRARRLGGVARSGWQDVDRLAPRQRRRARRPHGVPLPLRARGRPRRRVGDRPRQPQRHDRRRRSASPARCSRTATCCGSAARRCGSSGSPSASRSRCRATRSFGPLVGSSLADARGVRRARARVAQRGDRAARGRDRHRQGRDRRGAPRREPARRRSVRRRRLRRARRPARERAVRSREASVHRRRRAAHRRVRGGRPAARSSSTRSARCRSSCSRACCACSRAARSAASARRARRRSTSASSRRRTAICAAAVNEGRFRADLYYRLAVVRVRVPALRERATDLPELVAALLRTTVGDARRRSRG